MGEVLKVTQSLAKKLWDKLFGMEFKLKSFDDRRKAEGIEYTVQHSGSDEWKCDCPSFKFKTGIDDVEDLETGKIYKETCKHIRHCMSKQEDMKIRRLYRR